jgi:ABC-2 type transport system ATP-binding protein
VIEANGIAKRYGDFDALKPLTLNVEAGEVFGFLGPNGAGKSTTTKIFCGLIRPSEGHASVGGHDVVREQKAAQRLIGYLPERVPVYKGMTAREYLGLFARLYGIPAKDRKAVVEANLARVNLTGVEGKRVGKFSKGMTQRLGIARAILHDPKVLFFDEPSSGLDPTGRREIRALISALASEGRTVFMCSHDLGEVQATCTRVGFIRKGELVRVQLIGEQGAAQTREFRVEIAGDVAAAARALAAAPGVRSATADGQAHVRLETEASATRADLALAMQRAGLAALSIEETTSSLDALYRTYVEEPAKAAGEVKK